MPAANFKHKIIFIITSIILILTNSLPAVALDQVTLEKFAQNNIMFYDPEEDEAAQFCGGVSADCYIIGETWEERLWSGLRHVGFNPEQTAAVLANIKHEGSTPVRQEDCYNIARDNGYTTKDGKPYTIWTDHSSQHGDGMQTINGCSNYKSGNNVAGIGLGLVQWTYKNRREGYLNLMKDANLLKYFEGDAYKTYGRLTDEQLKTKIVEQTGSESEYWALYCIAIKYIWTEMSSSYTDFFNKNGAEEIAGFVSANYEKCHGCSVGDTSYTSRVATAKTLYEEYQSGKFNSVENNNTATSLTNSNTNTNDGSNITIIGDSITVRATTSIQQLLPNASIHAQDSKVFIRNSNDTSESTGGESGYKVLQNLKASGELRTNIVFALGTNQSNLTANDIKSVIDATGQGHTIYFLTNYKSTDNNTYTNNNKEFKAAADVYDNVKLIDWASRAKQTDGAYDDNDPIHPTYTTGVSLFAQAIKDAITNLEEGSLNCSTELIIYIQSDEPWGSMPYGDCGGDTIGAAGCGPSALAMVVTALTGKKVTPDVMAKKAAAGGYRACGNGSYHSIAKLAKDYGLIVKDYGKPSVSEITNYLRQGVMFQVAGSGDNPFTSCGHFIAIRGATSDGKWYIFDSAGSHKKFDNNTRAWDPSEIYPSVHSDWWGISRN